MLIIIRGKLYQNDADCLFLLARTLTEEGQELNLSSKEEALLYLEEQLESSGDQEDGGLFSLNKLIRDSSTKDSTPEQSEIKVKIEIKVKSAPDPQIKTEKDSTSN